MDTKICRQCGGDSQPLTEFPKHKQMADGHLNVCKTCKAAYLKGYHAENKKKHNAGSRAEYATRMGTQEGRDKERDRIAQWRADHPEAWKAARSKAQKSARGKATAALSKKTRRAREEGTRTGTISVKGVYLRYGMRCSICDKPIELQVEATIDHVVPLARGGTHTEDNLRPAHRRCNAWKGDRLPSELVGLEVPPPGEQDEWEARRREKARLARSEASRKWFAEATPEMLAARAAKISAKTLGKEKQQFGPRTPRARTPETSAKAGETNKQTWASKTPEERAAWVERCKARFIKPG
jgi:5-methylcytosine-specific restriction endonuclease McrA